VREREREDARTAGGEDGVGGLEAMQRAVLHAQCEDTDASALVHQQVQREVLNEVRRVEGERAAVERVQQRVARAVGGTRAAVRLATLAELKRLTTEGTLHGHTTHKHEMSERRAGKKVGDERDGEWTI
jgi:hypothetical protein